MRRLFLVLLLLLSGCAADLSGSRTRVDQCEEDCETPAECEARMGKRHPACIPTAWECVPCALDGGVR